MSLQFLQTVQDDGGRKSWAKLPKPSLPKGRKEAWADAHDGQEPENIDSKEVMAYWAELKEKHKKDLAEW